VGRAPVSVDIDHGPKANASPVVIFIKANQYVSQEGIIAVAWLGGGWLSGEVDKIGLVCLIAKQAFVGWLLSDLWFQWLFGRSPLTEHCGAAGP
jgi:hypothetical protein